MNNLELVPMANVNIFCLGYFPAHFAACWGQRECLERLLENGLRFDSVTKHGESPKNLALRYKHHHCAEFIDWAGIFV